MAKRYLASAAILLLSGAFMRLLGQTPLGDAELIEKENVVETSKVKGKWVDAKVGDKIPLRQQCRARGGWRWAESATSGKAGGLKR